MVNIVVGLMSTCVQLHADPDSSITYGVSQVSAAKHHHFSLVSGDRSLP